MRIFWILPLIIGILFLGTFSTAFAGAPVNYSTISNGDWNNGAIWQHPNPDPMLPPLSGVPGVGDAKFISHQVTVSSPVSNSGAVQIFGGELTVSDSFTNTGFVVGLTTNGVINFGSVIVTPTGIYHNNGLFENFNGQLFIFTGGQFNNNCASNNGHFHNEQANVIVEGTLTSTGDIHQLTNGIMNVTGTLENSTVCGIINNFAGSTLDNTGNSIANSGTINVFPTSTLINHANSLIDNQILGKIVLQGGTLVNEELGIIQNSGTVDNNASGTINNEGKIVNDGTITSASEIKNLYKGLIEQKNIFTNENGGILNNFGELNVTSIMTNDVGGIIDNKFDEPKVEFGNIYLFMNITNNGIVNDCGIINPPHKVHPTKSVLCDMDQDYLLDSWENHGIDFNHDKTIDLPLPGANEMHKDLYLELDYMEFHQPSNAAITSVVNSFANAPQSLVNNPDGQKGINLHVEMGEQVAHQDNLVMWSGFDVIKPDKFGTAAQRLDEAKIDAKKFSFRYVMFIHKMNGTGSSGRGELPGNDFVVSLGGFRGGAHLGGTDEQKSTTLMHEMGHTLGLRHGGDDNTNCKPNYLSIMSYSFQFSSLVPSRPLDYSRETLALLDENNLNETAGIQMGSFPKTIIGSVGSGNNRTATGIPIDYNNDGDTLDIVSRDISNQKGSCTAFPPIQPTTYAGHTDWDKLVFDFRSSSDFIADGDHPEAEIFDEMTQEDLDEMIANTFPLLCQVPVSGDWIVDTSCELAVDATTPGNVIVQNNSILTIPNGLTLTFDFATNNMTIEFGSGILIQSGGTIT